ncbi:MAG: cobyrinate a,c-diamide synthase [Thermodesulfovibrionales bacterium]|nr:cobyrinate a,c-diamide synthase [Thermodesulfovibrionales bacterium]
MIYCPRLTIAGLGGDTGKTVISVGLCRAWQKNGLNVIPFKKGPDYIDMGWLSLGASHPCYNLDLFLMNKDQTLFSFGIHTQRADIALIEGNRGLYDGIDVEGSVSTAELSKLLQSPVVLIVDCTKVTRTIAALVLGCQKLDTDVQIRGVILNRLANTRQETVIRKSIEHYCRLPVVGAIPRLTNITFPGRHLGLVPPQEHPMAEEATVAAAETAQTYLDLEVLWRIAKEAAPLEISSELENPLESPHTPLWKRGAGGDLKGGMGGLIKSSLRIGVIRDSAFQFYYPENLEAIESAGAQLIEFSALTDDLPSDLNALYIGGGFPETHAAALAANEKLRHDIKKAAEEGLPIYAECGGLMYLGEKLIWEGKTYPMAGVLPIIVGVSKKPQGHGYSIVEVRVSNPFFKTGQILRGHEFHYSRVLDITKKDGVYFAFRVKRGHGIVDKEDGLCYKNVLTTYTHLHALGAVEWVEGFVNKAMSYKIMNRIP